MIKKWFLRIFFYPWSDRPWSEGGPNLFVAFFSAFALSCLLTPLIFFIMRVIG